MALHTLDLNLITAAGAGAATVTLDRGVIAGWTGRDTAALQKHIKELEALGVKAPATTPIYYRVAARRFTTADTIECSGSASSGEAECVLLRHAGKTWVGVGSDHTDREVETYGIAVSKQVCDKPVGKDFWAFDEVVDHWDQLILRSYVFENGAKVLYQEGPAAALQPPQVLIKGATDGSDVLAENTMMLCGTHAAIGGIRPSPTFFIECEDPVLGRTLRHSYSTVDLPIAG
jgi:hypothetical protein